MLAHRQLSVKTLQWLQAGGMRRIQRWMVTGGTCTLIQLLLSWILLQATTVFWSATIAYAISGQISFVLNATFTFSERHPDIHFGRRWLKVHSVRWSKYLLVNGSAALLNGLIRFALASFAPWAVGFVVSNAISAPYNLILLDKIVFRHDEPPTELVERNHPSPAGN